MCAGGGAGATINILCGTAHTCSLSVVRAAWFADAPMYVATSFCCGDSLLYGILVMEFDVIPPSRLFQSAIKWTALSRR